MKVIFLDIDGVLNTVCTDGRHPFYRENPTRPGPVAQLGRILSATGARIVWSTTWRLRRNPWELDAWLHEHGLKAKSLDSTPDSARPLDGGLGILTARPRSEEVAEWLRAHPEVTHWVTIDDDMGAALDPARHVQCEDEKGGGLNQERADLAIRILGAEPERRAA